MKKVSRKPRNKATAYREWLVAHPEMVKKILAQLDSRTYVYDNDITRDHIQIVREVAAECHLS